MKYVTIAHCYEGLFRVAVKFGDLEEVPPYESNCNGVAKLGGVLSQAQEDWYKGFFEKAAFLFASVNKGHFFANGNKRLALAILVYFIYLNKYQHRSLLKKQYRGWFKEEFPLYKLSRRKFNTIYGWAFYNLNKAIASSTSVKFDELKGKTERFLKFTLIK